MAASDNSLPQVLILAGTTASGKTEVSIPLALRLNSVIISADSRQVYRELKIGTAPPTAQQLALVKHHFIGTRSLTERWTAGDFAREARVVINDCAERGIVPLVVGGSMLYLRALIDGLYVNDDEPEVDYVALKAEWDRRGADAMMRELESVDPQLAAQTHPADHHRVLRGLAIWRTTGRRFSEFRAEGSRPLSQSFRIYFLHGDRAETYSRVNHRAEQMLADGLVNEVRALLSLGFTEANCNALRTHGYQEVVPFLRGECDFVTMQENIKKAVRHYVKRQLTWFRREPRAIWVSRSFSESPEVIAERIYDGFSCS
ncbi:MAG: tRNA (adenosine(37)-N6)-dimethylallyltransferase MiaA [bacterium]|nr:tRNA (adenosine(37)-N6)-dimethylallyltransferase MiaA [bacterium]